MVANRWEQKDWLKGMLWITLFFAIVVCMTGFHSIDKYKSLFVSYVEVLVFASMGVCFCRGEYFKRNRYWFYMGFLVWIILTYWFRGGFMMSLENRSVFSMRCLLCGVALPFAQVTEDQERRKLLDSLIFLVLVLMAAMLWLCFIGALRGENIILLDKLVFGVKYNSTGRVMLRCMNLHYYRVGVLSVACFFSGLYLACSHWSKRSSVLWIFFLLTFSAGVIVTYSRTAVFAWAGGLVMAFYSFLWQKQIPVGKRLLLVGLAAAAALIVSAVGLNLVYQLVRSTRDVWYGLSTLTSRTEIWAAVPQVFRDYPSAMLYGLPLESEMDIVNEYLPQLDWIVHMHSGYMETLMAVGLPGFAAVLGFVVSFTVAARKVFFAGHGEAITLCDKLMVLVPVTSMIMCLTGSTLFYNVTDMEIMNVITALFCGYIFEKAWHNRPE